MLIHSLALHYSHATGTRQRYRESCDSLSIGLHDVFSDSSDYNNYYLLRPSYTFFFFFFAAKRFITIITTTYHLAGPISRDVSRFSSPLQQQQKS